MEHRERSQCVPQHQAGTAAGTPDPGLLRRRTEDGQRLKLPVGGSLPWHTQPAGGDRRRVRQANDSQPDQPLLRAAERDRRRLEPDRKKRPARKSDGGGNPPPQDNVIDSLSTGVIVADHNLLIETLNPAAENLLGISQTRARGQPLLQLIGDDKELADILHRCLATGLAYANELRLAPTEVQADERLVDCRVSLMQQPDADAALLIEMTDVTRRTRISKENALIIQHGAGRQMIRQLAHEIKNPLGGLRGAAQLLERQLDRDELKEYTGVIISEADRLAALVDTLLGPTGPPNKQPVNIHELLEYVARLVEPDFGDGLIIHRDYDAGLPLFSLDSDQMVQAFLNLVQNAASALEGHGTIKLRTRAEINFTIGDTCHRVVASVEIEDDGPGIPAELQDSVFYPLVTSRADGTGLGLPVAQELISRHGGLIEFESRPGRTVFQVRIPLTDPGESANDQ